MFTHQDFGGPVWPLSVQTCTWDPLGSESPAWTSPALPPARCFLPDWLTLFLLLLHSGPAVGAALLLGLQIPAEGKGSCPMLSGAGPAGERGHSDMSLCQPPPPGESPRHPPSVLPRQEESQHPSRCRDLSEMGLWLQRRKKRRERDTPPWGRGPELRQGSHLPRSRSDPEGGHTPHKARGAGDSSGRAHLTGFAAPPRYP